MKRECLIGALLGMAMFLSGCASTQYRNAAAQIQTANPHAALEYVALAIQDKPDDPETRRMLDGLIKTISRDHESRIELMRREKTYEEAVAECDRVIASAHLVSSLPGGNTVLFYEERERAELAQLAAEKHYQLALEYESQNQPREAADNYCRALAFRLNYKDAEKRRMDILSSATAKLFITCTGSKEEDAAKDISVAIGPAAMAGRPRFLKIAQEETNATSKCTICVESVSYEDSGWLATSLDKHTDAWSSTDKKTGKTTYYPARDVRGILYKRSVSCSMTANFSVAPIRATDPSPAGTASEVVTDSKAWANWQGDQGLLPNGVAALPRQEVALADTKVLKIHCVRRIVTNLGEQLFSAYK